MILVVNKIDLPPAWESGADAVRVSAKTGEGLEQLLEKISSTLVPEVPDPGEAVPVHPRDLNDLGPWGGERPY